MGLVQGATPIISGISRANINAIDFGSLNSWSFCARIRWALVGDIAGAQTLFSIYKNGGTAGLSITWNGTLFTVSIPGSTPLSTTLTIAAPSAATSYDLVVTFNGSAVSGYWRATSAGSAGLSTSTTTNAPSGGVAPYDALTTRDWYWLNDEALLTGFKVSARDLACFTGVLTAADIEMFGKGGAPFQLMSATLRMSPADIGGVPRDRMDGRLMTIRGTAASDVVANYDGPLFDLRTGLTSDESSNVVAHYGVSATRETGLIRSPLNDVTAWCDDSGGGAHFSANSLAVTSITRSGSVATVTFAVSHLVALGDNITIEGAVQPEYNGTFAIASGPSATTLTYNVAGTPATPATGTITALVSCPNYVLTDGKPSVSFMNTIRGGRNSMKFLNTRTAAGRTATGAISVGGVASCDAPTLGSGTGNMIRLADSGLGTIWQITWLAGSLSDSLRFGINNNLQTIPTTQTPRLLMPSNPSLFLCCNTGAGGANNHYARVNDAAALTTQTNTNATRYVSRLGSPTEATKQVAFTLYDLYVWNADKTSASNSIAASIRTRNALKTSLKAEVIIDSSTGEGSVCDYGLHFVRLQREVNAAGVPVFNFGIGGAQVGAQRMTGVTRTGAGSGLSFTLGETVTDGATGVGVFLAEDPPEAGGQIWLASTTAAFAASSTLLGATSGATRSYTATVASAGPLAGSTRIAQIVGALAPYSTSNNTICFVINSASNGVAAGASAAVSYAADVALVALLRAAFPTPRLKFVLRMFQPRIGLPAGVAVAYRALARAGAGRDFDVYCDMSLLSQFSDYAGASSYSNLTYYNADQTHLNNGGHLSLGQFKDAIIAAILGLLAKDSSFRNRGGSRGHIMWGVR